MQASALPPYRQVSDVADKWRHAARAIGKVSPPPRPPRVEEPDPVVTASRAFAEEAILRAAAFETGAVEGLYASKAGVTRMIAESAEGWEAALDDAGSEAPDKFGDQLDGYMWARDFAATDTGESITAATIRELHKVVTRTQVEYETDKGPMPLHHGEYKKGINYTEDRFGRSRQYCPPELIDPELTTALDLHRELTTLTNDPDVMTAFLHWMVAHIHPFEDGNGRVARVLASVPTLAQHRIPVLVFADQKTIYLQALDAADHGNVQLMIDYTRARTEDTVAWQRSIASLRRNAEVAGIAAAITAIIEAQSSPPEPAADVISRVAEAVRHAIDLELAAVGDVPSMRIARPDDVSNGSGTFTLSLKEPFPARAETSFQVTMASATSATVQLTDTAKNTRHQDVRLRITDVSPGLSNEAGIRIQLFAELLAQRLATGIRTDVSGVARGRGSLPAGLD